MYEAPVLVSMSEVVGDKAGACTYCLTGGGNAEIAA